MGKTYCENDILRKGIILCKECSVSSKCLSTFEKLRGQVASNLNFQVTRRQKKCVVKHKLKIQDKHDITLEIKCKREKLRRQMMRKYIDGLQSVIPSVWNRDRITLVTILRSATIYCLKLSKKSEKMEKELKTLKRKQLSLRKRLGKLRRKTFAGIT